MVSAGSQFSVEKFLDGFIVVFEMSKTIKKVTCDASYAPEASSNQNINGNTV